MDDAGQRTTGAAAAAAEGHALSDGAKWREPYVGPEPFAERDHARFFGREREVRDLTSVVLAHRLVTVFGESGSGKSSLLAAGLLPRLRQRGACIFGGGRLRPEDASAEGRQAEEAGNFFTFNLLRRLNHAAPGALKIELAPTTTLRDAFVKFRHLIDIDTTSESAPRARSGRSRRRLMLVIIDQFEELLTFRPDLWRQRQTFMEQLADALKPDQYSEQPDRDTFPPHVVLAVRADYLASLHPFTLVLPDLERHTFPVERLGESAARAAITRPVAKTQQDFEPGVADQLIDQLLQTPMLGDAGTRATFKGAGIEPVHLQIACLRLWRIARARGDRMRAVDLQALGSVDGILQRFYQDELGRAVAAARGAGAREAAVRRWFSEELIASGVRKPYFAAPAADRDRGPVTRLLGVLGRGAGDDPPADVIRLLDERHVIRSEPREGGGYIYEIAHDRLVAPIQQSNDEYFRARRKPFQIAGVVAAVALLGVGLLTWHGFARWQATLAAWKDAADLHDRHHAAGSCAPGTCDLALSAETLADVLVELPPPRLEGDALYADQPLPFGLSSLAMRLADAVPLGAWEREIGAVKAYFPRWEIMTRVLGDVLRSPELQRYLVHDDGVLTGTWGAAGARLWTLTRQGTLHAFDDGAGLVDAALVVPPPAAWSASRTAALVETPDSALRLAIADGAAVELLSAEVEALWAGGHFGSSARLTLPADATPRALAFDRGGTRLAVGTAAGDVYLAELDGTATGPRRLAFTSAGNEREVGASGGEITALAFSPDGTRLAVGGCSDARYGAGRDECVVGQVRLVDMARAPAAAVLTRADVGLGPVGGLAFVGDGSTLAVTSWDGLTQICAIDRKPSVVFPPCGAARDERRSLPGPSRAGDGDRPPTDRSMLPPGAWATRSIVLGLQQLDAASPPGRSADTSSFVVTGPGGRLLTGSGGRHALLWQLGQDFPGSAVVFREELDGYGGAIERIGQQAGEALVVLDAADRNLALLKPRGDDGAGPARLQAVARYRLEGAEPSRRRGFMPPAFAVGSWDDRPVVAAVDRLVNVEAMRPVAGFEYLALSAAAFVRDASDEPLFVHGTVGRELTGYGLGAPAKGAGPHEQFRLDALPVCANASELAGGTTPFQTGINAIVENASSLVVIDNARCLRRYAMGDTGLLHAASRSLGLPAMSLAAETRTGRLAVGTADGTVYYWPEAADLERMRELSASGQDDRSPIRRLAFAEHEELSDLLFATDASGRALLWHIDRGERVPAELRLHHVAVSDLFVTNDGERSTLVSSGVDLAVEDDGLRLATSVRRLPIRFEELACEIAERLYDVAGTSPDERSAGRCAGDL